MKLLSIKLPDLPILRSLSHFFCATPPATLKGFIVKVRGRAVYLVSPPGWQAGLSEHQRDPKGPRQMIGPLEAGKDCVLGWEGDDPDGTLKYDSEPMGLAQMTDEELERATAPKAAGAKR